MSVFVLDRNKRPLMPCSEKRARKLLDSGRARVHRLTPFVIRLIDRRVKDCLFQPLRIKLDPGSKTTGLALVREDDRADAQTGEVHKTAHVMGLFELVHRGRQISEGLTARRQMRRRRRSQLRYRAPRFLNRGGDKQGWLAPSLQHRVETTCAWVKRIQGFAPVAGISSELVRFDTQLMQAQAEGQEISGVQYQQGTLAGYEVREYLLAKWDRTCAYCGAEHVPLQIEHIHAKAKGGTNRVSNLTLACQDCNHKKGAQSIEMFLAKQPDRLKRILVQAQRPLKDAAAVNATRWALVNALNATGLSVETGSGGQTKFNRTRFAIPKTHALDAVCVGNVNAVKGWQVPTLQIKAMGRGSHCRTRLDRFGFPRGYLIRQKSVHGFRTGDMVMATVPKGKKSGVHKGRVAVRATGSFNIQTGKEVIQGVGHKHCKVTQRGDGYGYSFNPKIANKDTSQALSLPMPEGRGFSRNAG